MAWPRSAGHAPSDCPRLLNWLSGQDALSGVPSPLREPLQLNQRLRAHALQLNEARMPLVWVESADVSAMRAAVRFAEACSATLHVAQSPGAQNVAAVIGACGTFGTSLAEVAAHADLIVHVGHRHLQELPRLAPRFLQAATAVDALNSRRHVLIGDQPLDAWSAVVDDAVAAEPLVLRWPRHQWLDSFTRVLVAARGDAPSNHSPSDPIAEAAEELAELLAASRYAVIIWDEDEFADQLDRLLVERLFSIAQHFSRTTRCSLLPLGNDAGRTTSQETLLWLTNIAATARCLDGKWTRSHIPSEATLDVWQAEHDWILCLRNLPSDRPLPDLQFDMVIDAACNALPTSKQVTSQSRHAEVVYVAAVGLESPGHLTRLDHAFAAHLDALDCSSEPAHKLHEQKISQKTLVKFSEQISEMRVPETALSASTVIGSLTSHVLTARGERC